jgi:peptidoglycan/xylan/chitin deacetylase (PgdA/CDA1 family)
VLAPGNHRLVAGVELTFDDGPDPRWTPAVLDALAEARLEATFYVIAPRAGRYPELVNRARAAGHAVELHCHAHVRHTDLDDDGVASDAATALRTLRRLGVSPRRWRTPWGRTTCASYATAARHGLEVTGWDLDTHDWRGDGAPAMLSAIEPGLRPGAVVLAHDGLGPGARRDGCAATVALVRLLGARLRDLGLAGGDGDTDGRPSPSILAACR